MLLWRSRSGGLRCSSGPVGIALLRDRTQKRPAEPAAKADEGAEEGADRRSTQVVDGRGRRAAAPNELSLTWVATICSRRRATSSTCRSPSDRSARKPPAKALTVYWRVVDQAAAAAPATPPAATQNDSKTTTPAPRVDFAYEDLNTVDGSTAPSGPEQISRSFAVAARHLRRLRRGQGADARKAAEERAAAEDVADEADREVPDLWNGELNTSSVIVAERIDPLPAPLTPQQQAERPVRARHDGNRAGRRHQVRQEGRALDLHADLQREDRQREQARRHRRVQLLREAGGRREVLQQDEPAEPERPDAAAAVRFRGRPPAPERTGRAAGLVPGRRLPARDQGHRQARRTRR